MDMRNVAVGVVMEVIATTAIMQPVPEEETTWPSLANDNTAVVLTCPQTSGLGSVLNVSSRLPFAAADNSGPVFLAEPCEGPTSLYVGARAGTTIAA